MPIIKSAKKKLRQDKKRTSRNNIQKKITKKAILTFKRNNTPKNLAKVFSLLDIAAKKKIFHPNKTARLKSRLSKLLGKKPLSTVKKSKTTPKPKSPKKKKIIV